MRTRGLAGADDANISGKLECVVANGIPIFWSYTFRYVSFVGTCRWWNTVVMLIGIVNVFPILLFVRGLLKLYV